MSNSLDSVVATIRNLCATLPPAQRIELTEKLGACVSGNSKSDKVDAMSAAREALTLEESRTPIVSPLQCAAARPDFAPRIRRVKAQLQRLGLDWYDDKLVDVHELNAVMAKSDNFNERLQIRSELFSLGLIPA